jgi:hypothetical protein
MIRKKPDGTPWLTADEAKALMEKGYKRESIISLPDPAPVARTTPKRLIKEEKDETEPGS